MAFVITSKNNEKIFNQKLIKIGNQNCDFNIYTGFDFVLTIQYSQEHNKCMIVNKNANDNLLFKGEILPEKLIVEKVCKIMIKNSDEYITVKILDNSENTPQENIAGNNKINSHRDKIEQARVKIAKEISAPIGDLKRSVSVNSKYEIFLHITLFLASIICAFGVSNYMLGLTVETTSDIIQMPVNIKLVIIYSVIIYSVGLMLKQGFFLYLQNKIKEKDKSSLISEKLMIVLPLIFYIAIYLINVAYYISPKFMSAFAIAISAFYTGTAMLLSLGCGYFKNANTNLKKELDKYEYREDFEHVIRAYQGWITDFVNSLSQTKIEDINNRKIKLEMKSFIELFFGIITAPFLAYGVSNTLAMCFPEAAGWLRIGGLRFSPIFLVLASFMIIFAFFSFVQGFVTKKKIKASDIIKLDGFNNYFQHGTDIYGLEGIKQLESEKQKFFMIGIAIIFIEFTMNISYFMGEIGGNLSGIFLSAVAALVPTALLIAETIMLSASRFEIYVLDELLSKIDR